MAKPRCIEIRLPSFSGNFHGMVQKQINNFVQINRTDNFSTVDVTTRVLMDFECVPGDQQKSYTLTIFVYFTMMTVGVTLLWKMTTYCW